MDLASLITSTAQSMQMEPLDLATILSYETAGTFDPMKRGPTTQWGQHRGLIQFGEPQARQHGVDFSSPDAAVASQLGPDGAIVDYFRSNGWRPGMGLLDAYSIVNAGAPGRYNASDAQNGGAWGTVADKVNHQMDGHRKKAADLLGGIFSPRPAAAPRPNLTFGSDVPAPPTSVAELFMQGVAPGALDMGVPVPGQVQREAPMERQRREQKEQIEQDQDRRIALADLIRY